MYSKKINRFEGYQLANIAVVIFVCAMCLRILYHMYYSSDAYLHFVTDDFYYYLLPARNLVTKGISSFDGATITNGYHPLWMLCVSGLYLSSFGNEQIFFSALALICSLSTYITFRYLYQLSTCLFPDNTLLYAFILPVVLIFGGLIFLGMEIVLTIPLYLLFLLKLSQINFTKTVRKGTSFSLGFITSLLLLSRLDTGILIVLTIAFILGQNHREKKIITHFIYNFCLGGILVPIYFLSNYFLFGHFLTVSTSAKALSPLHNIDFSSLMYLAFNRDAIGGLFLIPIGLCLLLFSGKYSIQQKLLCYIILLYPLFYYLIILINSSWFLNRWYFYPIPFATLVTLGLLTEFLFSKFPLKISNLIATLSIIISSSCLITFSIFIFLRDTVDWKPETNAVYVHAKQMKSFVQLHPGYYAMGDRAGLTAYILNVPILQLEGLNADFGMRDHIQYQDNLLSVLEEYHVDYLIETSDKEGLPKKQNCYIIEEPHSAQAGKPSNKMRTNICHEPIYTLTTGMPNEMQVKTYIFDLKK